MSVVETSGSLVLSLETAEWRIREALRHSLPDREPQLDVVESLLNDANEINGKTGDVEGLLAECLFARRDFIGAHRKYEDAIVLSAAEGDSQRVTKWFSRYLSTFRTFNDVSEADSIADASACLAFLQKDFPDLRDVNIVHMYDAAGYCSWSLDRFRDAMYCYSRCVVNLAPSDPSFEAYCDRYRLAAVVVWKDAVSKITSSDTRDEAGENLAEICRSAQEILSKHPTLERIRRFDWIMTTWLDCYGMNDKLKQVRYRNN